MKRTNSKKMLMMIFALLAMFVISCGDSDDDTPTAQVPFAAFSTEVDETNTLTVNFTNTSIDAASYAWEFGDGVGSSTEASPSYTYPSGGTYTVTLTATNSAGVDVATEEITVSSFGANLLVNGDFESTGSWSELAIWNSEDNAVLHSIENGEYMFQNGSDSAGNKYEWSNYAIFQAVTLTAGSTYQFSAELRSPSGTNATWFEVYLVKDAPVDESNIGGEAAQFFIKSFGEGEDCSATPFDNDILVVANDCPLNTFPLLMDDEGFFTVSAADLNSSNQLYLVFKTGSGFAADGETAGYQDGIYLDNVEIKEVL